MFFNVPFSTRKDQGLGFRVQGLGAHLTVCLVVVVIFDYDIRHFLLQRL